MLYYLITCRSLTYAQRTATVLERAGILTRTLRSPKRISSDGCGYCVRVAKRDLEMAKEILHQSGLEPKRVFAAMSDGGYMEMTL